MNVVAVGEMEDADGMKHWEDSGVEPEEPFGALVPLHLHAMLQTAAALVGASDAEDATQEAILRAWRAWDTLRDVAAVRGWLLRITVHICQDWQRGRFGTRRMRTVPLLDDDALPLADLGADPGASDPTGALDLRAAINTLPYDLRVVVALRYYAAMDATEVGELLGLPAPTVRTRLRRALKLLRDRLDGPDAAATNPPPPPNATATYNTHSGQKGGL